RPRPMPYTTLIRSGNIAAALVEGQLHHEPAALAQGGDVPFRIQDLDLVALLDAVGSDLTGAHRLDAHRLGPVRVQLCSDTLQVQDNFGNVFLDVLNGGELVDYDVDLVTGRGDAGQRRQKNSVQAVT